MEAICFDSRSFADPFCGSGTVLFEAGQRGSNSWGVEVNPAAWHLASLAEFSSLSLPEKKLLSNFVKTTLAELSAAPEGLFKLDAAPDKYLTRVLDQSSSEAEAKVLAAAIIVGMGNGVEFSIGSLQRGLFAISSVVNQVLEFNATSSCILGDARNTGVPAESVDAVITSPPYINVFNYHQNFRPAAELLGWKPLQAAKVEIGANRKFRQNRFLTAIQYCIDMQQALSEMSRYLKTGAPLVIVLGRTSNVLGCSLENGTIVKSLLQSGSGFGRVRQAERVFVNRYGERIFEDIIVAERLAFAEPDVNSAKIIGRDALRGAVGQVSEANRPALTAAIEAFESVQPSADLAMDIPAAFSAGWGKEEDGNRSNRSARR